MEKTDKIHSAAKINLNLRILGKKENNFHELSLLNCKIDLKDEILISKTEKETEVETYFKNEKTEIKSKENLIYKAYELLKKEFNISNYNVKINKKTPISAGLGGGSSNAAEFLKYINKKERLNLSFDKLKEIAAKIGSDVIYCIHDKPAIVKGVGEIIEEIDLELKEVFLIMNFGIPISSKNAYSTIDYEKLKSRKFIKEEKEKLLKSLKEKNIKKSYEFMQNDFEENVLNKNLKLKEKKEEIYKFGASKILLAGSGSSLIVFFDDENKKEKTKKHYSKEAFVVESKII